MAGVDNDPSSAEGKLAPGATSDYPVPLPPLPFRLPAEEPQLGVPDDEAADFMERRKLAHRLAELSGEHLQVWESVKDWGALAPEAFRHGWLIYFPFGRVAA